MNAHGSVMRYAFWLALGGAAIAIFALALQAKPTLKVGSFQQAAYQASAH